jgi:hypothetical protein
VLTKILSAFVAVLALDADATPQYGVVPFDTSTCPSVPIGKNAVLSCAS